jgi:L-aminopeptidase/D-esterase-like protein
MSIAVVDGVDVDGVLVGHSTDEVARTGCTVVLFPDGTVASGEVRGGAPATREFALLDPHLLVQRLDAVMFSGGSAYGLASGDGAMRWLEGEGRGFKTDVGVVPIVVGLSIFDLTVGDGSVRPGAEEGYEACVGATAGTPTTGRIGAGTGATVAKWGGRERARPGGLVSATVVDGALRVAALVVVNSVGSPTAGDEQDLARGPRPGFGNTTVAVVVTNAELTKLDCFRVAQGGHDGMARAITPPHTGFDGDAVVAAATGAVDGDPEQVRALAVLAVERAIGQLEG